MQHNLTKYRTLLVLMTMLWAALSHATGVTVESLRKEGIHPMRDAEIKKLIVGNIIVVRNTETLANFAARFDKSGKRILQRVTALKDGPRIVYQTLGDAKDANIANYEIKNNRLITHFENQSFEVLMFKVKGKYYGARSTDGGFIKWELVLVTK